MDILASLNLEDLPEQQTRTAELIEKYPDFDLKLGFDACCSCGSEITSQSAIQCSACRRVNYCSEACREQDASVKAVFVPDGQEDLALGHSSVVCMLLSLCNDDEAVEAKEADHLQTQLLERAQDRIRSEDESYPATLANILSTGPCYQAILTNRTKLVVHVLGASIDSEFWGLDLDGSEDLPCFDAYAEALAELSDTKGLDEIELIFIGPECPSRELHLHRRMTRVDQGKGAGVLVIRSFQDSYSTELLSSKAISKPDIAVFFNPGFTVPEYDWKGALAALPLGTPFLSTTNTELEGIADCQFMLDQDRIQTLPPGLADVFGLLSSGDDEGLINSETHSFFTVNPFAGSRVRQSGTLANDLYVKNRWVLGGIIGTFDPSKSEADVSGKRQKTFTEGSGNSKGKNPALI